MIMRIYNDVILELTIAWSLVSSCMNELLVSHRKGLTQWDLPVPGPANVHTSQTLCIFLRLQHYIGYIYQLSFMGL